MNSSHPFTSPEAAERYYKLEGFRLFRCFCVNCIVEHRVALHPALDPQNLKCEHCDWPLNVTELP